MHKSIILLLGLLVILLPVGSSNLISNANAIASEDEYYSDQYNERYANDEYYGQKKIDRIHMIMITNPKIEIKTLVLV